MEMKTSAYIFCIHFLKKIPPTSDFLIISDITKIALQKMIYFFWVTMLYDSPTPSNYIGYYYVNVNQQLISPFDTESL